MRNYIYKRLYRSGFTLCESLSSFYLPAHLGADLLAPKRGNVVYASLKLVPVIGLWDELQRNAVDGVSHMLGEGQWELALGQS